MPIRDYQCECGHEFEEVVGHDDPNPNCPQCESSKVFRLPSAHGGYKMNSGGASTRPKSAGSFRKSK